MQRVILGVWLGIGCGVVDVLLMIPMDLPERRTAMAGAFASRFALGFFTAVSDLQLPPIARGMLVGLLTSLPDAIITKGYIPIIPIGVVLGAVAGWVTGRLGGGQGRR